MTDLPLRARSCGRAPPSTASGNPTAGPGRVIENGDWVEKDDGFTWARTASVSAVVNLTSPDGGTDLPAADADLRRRTPIRTVVLGATQTQRPGRCPRTGSDAGGQLALALGLVVDRLRSGPPRCQDQRLRPAPSAALADEHRGEAGVGATAPAALRAHPRGSGGSGPEG